MYADAIGERLKGYLSFIAGESESFRKTRTLMPKPWPRAFRRPGGFDPHHHHPGDGLGGGGKAARAFRRRAAFPALKPLLPAGGADGPELHWGSDRRKALRSAWNILRRYTKGEGADYRPPFLCRSFGARPAMSWHAPFRDSSGPCHRPFYREPDRRQDSAPVGTLTAAARSFRRGASGSRFRKRPTEFFDLSKAFNTMSRELSSSTSPRADQPPSERHSSGNGGRRGFNRQSGEILFMTARAGSSGQRPPRRANLRDCGETTVFFSTFSAAPLPRRRPFVKPSPVGADRKGLSPVRHADRPGGRRPGRYRRRHPHHQA